MPGIGRILTAQEREEQRLVANLQRMNIYPQLVRKLTDRQSANSVARWAMTMNVEGPAGKWGFSYWNRHTTALAKYVKAAKEKMWNEESRRRMTVAPVRPDPVAVLAKVDAVIEERSELDYVPASARDVFEHVLGAEKELSSIHYLRYAAMKAVKRLEKLERLDNAMPVIMVPNGHKELQAMAAICANLMKHEFGTKLMRGKNAQLPTEVDGLPPLAKQLLEYDEVDRSILRELTVRVVEMAQEKASGRFEAVRVEGDAAGAGTEAAGDNVGPAESPVPEGS